MNNLPRIFQKELGFSIFLIFHQFVLSILLPVFRAVSIKKKKGDDLQLITNFISYFPSSLSKRNPVQSEENFSPSARWKLNFFPPLAHFPLTFKTFPSLTHFFFPPPLIPRPLSLSQPARIALFQRKTSRIHASGTNRNGIMIEGKFESC